LLAQGPHFFYFPGRLAMLDKRNARRGDILPASLAPIGLSRECAAAYIGVGTTLFDEMVSDGRMPPPRLLGGRTVWDTEELYLAFKALPHRGQPATASDVPDWSKMT
jgi:predicted DNA-binding transcriptional regulator AlpA